jgi:hypothetical protein
MTKKKEVHVQASDLKQPPVMTLNEYGERPGVERVAERSLIPEAELAAFMEDLIDIIVSPGYSEESLPVITPGVMGVNQPIIRGLPQRVKRKYVEALARGTRTGFSQVRDMYNLEKCDLKPNTVTVAPFTVIRDPAGERGTRWLRGIYTESVGV